MAKLLTLGADDLYRNLLKPQIKVGNEYVTQGRNKDQVNFSIGGKEYFFLLFMGRSLNLFWLPQNLFGQSGQSANIIGISRREKPSQ